ncbi:MAG: enamine deaminase RidA [Candidatus Tectimicrobiota bacterium]|nr:MAG: enamine deaminase RidA [Candidatus Tectomicrobia bacterium]
MPDKTLINPPTLARPVGYSHAVKVEGGTTVYLAGQTGQDASGRIAAPGDIVAQFRQALHNLKAVAEAAGVALTDVVKLTLYVTACDTYRANARAIGAVYREFFGSYYPAMTLVEVRRLWDEAAMVEIEGIAVR